MSSDSSGDTTALADSGRAVSEAYEDAVERNLEVAQAISEYRFPTVDIRKTTASTNEEEVAEIFVRPPHRCHQ